MSNKLTHITGFYTDELKSLLYIIKNQDNLLTNSIFPFHFDLTKLIELAERFKLTPLIFRYYIKNPDIIEGNGIEKLKTLTLNHSLKSLNLLNQLLSICREFNRKGIKYTVIKGPQLSHYLYSDPTLRVSVDIDIFLSEFSSISIAAEELKKAGYGTTNIPDTRKFSFKLFSLAKHEIWFFNRITKTHVDLHYRPVKNRFYSARYFKLFLSEKIDYLINGIHIPVLNNEKYFLFLCYHGVVHSFSSLLWLNDVYVFSQKIDFDQEKVKKEAEKLGLINYVKVAYAVMFYLFKKPVPSVFQYRNSVKYRFLIRKCLKSFTYSPKYYSSLLGRLENTFYTLLLADSLIIRIEIIISILSRYTYRLFFFRRKRLQ